MNNAVTGIELDRQVSQIVDALRTLPPDKVAEVSDFVDFLQMTYGQSQVRNDLADFEAEVAAFEGLRPQLQNKYGGKVVAIHGGRVVMEGQDKLSVLDAVLAKFGPVPCYIEYVDPQAPRRVRVPSTRLAR